MNGMLHLGHAFSLSKVRTQKLYAVWDLLYIRQSCPPPQSPPRPRPCPRTLGFVSPTSPLLISRNVQNCTLYCFL